METLIVELDERIGKPAAKRLIAFAQAARESLPNDVMDVILFGSRARGNNRRNSDWDVAILISDENRRVEVRRQLGGLAALMSDFGFHISPLVVPAPGGVSNPSSWIVSSALANAIASEGIGIPSFTLIGR